MWDTPYNSVASFSARLLSLARVTLAVPVLIYMPAAACGPGRPRPAVSDGDDDDDGDGRLPRLALEDAIERPVPSFAFKERERERERATTMTIDGVAGARKARARAAHRISSPPPPPPPPFLSLSLYTQPVHLPARDSSTDHTSEDSLKSPLIYVRRCIFLFFLFWLNRVINCYGRERCLFSEIWYIASCLDFSF